MVNAIQNYSINAIMADAAYANLSTLNDPEKAKEENRAALLKRGFTELQTQDFFDKYSVAFHYPDDLMGLSFTIFKDNASDALTLAIRGTTPGIDFLEDAVLLGTGLAQDQAISLFNALQILTTTPTIEGFVQAAKFQYTEVIDGVLYGFKETCKNSGRRDESTKTALIDYDIEGPNCNTWTNHMDEKYIQPVKNDGTSVFDGCRNGEV